MGPFKGTVVYNYISSIHHSGFPWEHEATVTTTSEMWNFKGDIFYSKVLTTKKSNICSQKVNGLSARLLSRNQNQDADNYWGELSRSRNTNLSSVSWHSLLMMEDCIRVPRLDDRYKEIIWFLSSWLADLMINCLIFCGRSVMISIKWNKRNSSFISSVQRPGCSLKNLDFKNQFVATVAFTELLGQSGECRDWGAWQRDLWFLTVTQGPSAHQLSSPARPRLTSPPSTKPNMSHCWLSSITGPVSSDLSQLLDRMRLLVW